MRTARLPPEAPIDTRILWAKRWWKEFGERLLANQGVASLAMKVRTATRQSRAAMAEAGIIQACRDCEENGGSCCGRGLERHYTDALLLANLLLGVELPTERPDIRSCFFLGREGCLLLARHVLCINYLCHPITSRIDASRIARLRGCEGVEIEHLFHLNEAILRILSRRDAGGPAEKEPPS